MGDGNVLLRHKQKFLSIYIGCELRLKVTGEVFAARQKQAAV